MMFRRHTASALVAVLGASTLSISLWHYKVHAQPASKSPLPISNRMESLVNRLQADLTSALESVEGQNGSKFIADRWTRDEGGYGTSCVLQNGRVFEKAGVNISIIASPAPPAMLKQMRARKPGSISDSKEYEMFVAGLSTVCHPHNPFAPTFHANYRYFELKEKGSQDIAAAWFGGGCDLTPCYLFNDDAEHFHKVIKRACDKHDESYYPRFKKWCDSYFRNTHRDEGRGIGGIFFDDLEHGDHDKLYHFVKDCGESLAEQYIPIVNRRKDMPFTAQQKEWQQIRRGRYVEFNLVHDRGTKFGLVTPGVRIESVLMSLPLTARWEYNHYPAPASWEAETLAVLRNPKDWAE